MVVATSNWGFSSFIFLNVDAKRFAFSGLGNVLTLSRNVLRLVCSVFLNHRLQIKVFYTFFTFFLMRVFSRFQLFVLTLQVNNCHLRCLCATAWNSLSDAIRRSSSHNTLHANIHSKSTFLCSVSIDTSLRLF